jgi:uncharacterized protein (DUF927 family)
MSGAAFQTTGTLNADLPKGYNRAKGGIWFQPEPKSDGTTPDPIWVCANLEIEAETNDDAHHAHGLLLRWTDRAGHLHVWAMPRRMVHADGNVIAAELEDAGLHCGTSRAAHERLKDMLGAVRVKRRVRCVDHAGWHGTAYILPDARVFGAAAITMQTEHVITSSAFASRGTLDEWRDKIARYAVGNDLLVLHISGAFASPLLDIVGDPSGGLHLAGISQSGKTTLLCSAASVWGPGDSSGQIRSWRATANGLEGVAAETCDLPLFLDELGQASAKEVGDVIYMLANQAGKARANRAGGARRHKTWRVLFFSTGEISPAAKMADAGLRSQAGQDVRLITLSADAGAGLGVWNVLHGMPSSAALSDHLRDASRVYCGTAGVAFLDMLVRDRDADAVFLAATLTQWRDGFLKTHLPANADGQVRSVANRFALIGAAGELARAYDIVPWPKGEAIRAAGKCFQSWLHGRGGFGAAEDLRAVETVRAFIALHGNSRFEAVTKNSAGADEIDERRTVTNRAGWRRKDAQDQWEYCILPAIWRAEVCRGLDPNRVARVLADKGLLAGATAKHPAASVLIPGQDSRLRLYRVPASILGEDAP